MSLKTRRLLFIAFITLFLIITPLIISYAIGYKFVFDKKFIQKTGMLVLNTNPDGVKIYLDNTPQQTFFKKFFKNDESFVLTPARIKNLIPGKYDIRLEKDGYWEWSKTLEIKSGIATFAEDIYLFKKNLPYNILMGEITKIYPSPNSKYIAALGKENIYIISLESDEVIFEINNIKTEYDPFITWSQDDEKIVINSMVYNISNRSKTIDLEEYIEVSASNLKWYNNDKILYISKEIDLNISTIKSFNLNTKSTTKLISDNYITDFLVKDENIFVINQIAKSTNLDIYSMDNMEKIRNIELQSEANYTLINPDHRLINLYDIEHKILYLINPWGHSPLEEKIENVNNSYWVNDNKLMYNNDFEIWSADFSLNKSDKKILVTRISDKINKTLWHPSNNYILFSTNSFINTIELDNRNKYNITELLKLENISSLYLNKSGHNLYFFSKIGNQKGLYKLNIQ